MVSGLSGKVGGDGGGSQAGGLVLVLETGNMWLYLVLGIELPCHLGQKFERFNNVATPKNLCPSRR